MANYAVVKIGPRQYIVEPEKTYTVEKFPAEVGAKLDLETIAVGSEKDINTSKGTNVKVEILDQGKGEKVVTKQFKAKSRYRRTRGFRKQVTTFKVLDIK